MERIKSIAVVFCMILFASCDKVEIPSGNDEGEVTLTFPIYADFSGGSFSSRASSESMKADGKEMTDLWLFDFVGESVAQQIHLTPADAQWGAPTLTLPYGQHHLVFCASRSTSPTLNGTELRWEKVLDTFYLEKDITVTYTTKSSGVTLNRIVTDLRATIDDAVPSGITAITAQPDPWFDGINLATGDLLGAADDKKIEIAFKTTDTGIAGLMLNYYWLAPSDSYTSNITITSWKGDDVFTSVSFEGHFMANRKSDYHGSLFGVGNGSQITLNETWQSSYDGGSWND